MPKNKIKKFEEYNSFPNTYDARDQLGGKWHDEVFRNNNPITLELACGRGEYTVGLADLFPERNFIGIDVKASRMWKGAKYALDNNLKNVAFLRIQIDFLASFFRPGEIDEIWITFPDPQPQKPRAKQRLTHEKFLDIYRLLLGQGRPVHLKTDSEFLMQFTLETLERANARVLELIQDIDRIPVLTPELKIRTYYEQMWREKEIAIRYLKFCLS